MIPGFEQTEKQLDALTVRGDLISRQSVINMFQNLTRDDWNKRAVTTWALAYSECAEMIRKFPSAEHPEIIRCKDCRFYEWMSNRVPEEQTWHCHNWNTETGKNEFCSYAERRTDE